MTKAIRTIPVDQATAGMTIKIRKTFNNPQEYVKVLSVKTGTKLVRGHHVEVAIIETAKHFKTLDARTHVEVIKESEEVGR